MSEIDLVSLTGLADKLSKFRLPVTQTTMANEVAENIQHIFAVTEQTGEGTRELPRSRCVKLSHMAKNCANRWHGSRLPEALNNEWAVRRERIMSLY